MAALDQVAARGAQPDQLNVQRTVGWTDAKIKKVALYVIAGIVALAGVAVIALCVASVITWPWAFGALVLFAASGGLLYWACSIKDYDNPVELQLMKDKSWTQSYSELIQDHGDNVYRVVSHAVLNEKQALAGELRFIDSQYPDRQECRLRALDRQEYAVRQKAKELGRNVRQIGYGTTMVASSLQGPRSRGTLSAGLLLSELAGTVVDVYSQSQIQDTLVAIGNERVQIRQNNIGLADQRAYEQAIAQACQQSHQRLEQMRIAG